MPSKIFAFTFVLLLLGPNCSAKEIGGVDFSDTLEISRGELVLNGAGIRTKFFLKLYVGGLYLKERSKAPKEIIAADEPMAIRLQIISTMITSEKMENATREGFQKSTSGNIEQIKPRIESFIAVFKEKIEENDVYDLRYSPGIGVAVFKNGKLYSLIEGLDFKQALFGIWLGDPPAQKSLKNEMLGL